MSKAVYVNLRVHKAMPECCRKALVQFAAHDRYKGGGEPGDRIRCSCGNWLVYDWRGWRAAEAHPAAAEEPR